MKNIFRTIKLSELIHSMPLRRKITAVIVLMALVPMCLAGFYFYWNISSILTKNAYSNLNQLIDQTSENLENSFGIIDNTSFHFASNKTIRAWATDDKNYMDSDMYDLFLKKSEIEAELKYSLLFNTAWDSKLITTAYLFMDPTTFCSISRSNLNIKTIDQQNMDIYEMLSSNKKKERILIPPSFKNQTIYSSRNIFNLNNPSLCLKLIIGTDEAVIFKKYENILNFPDSRAFIMDNQGVIYSHPDKTLLGHKVEDEILQMSQTKTTAEIRLDNNLYLMGFKKIKNSNLIFVTGVPRQQVLIGLNDSIKNYLLITLLIIGACLVFSILLSFWISRFLKNLLFYINNVKSGNYDSKMPVYKDVELNSLSTTFNNMTDEIKYLIDEVYKKQLLVKETEFKFLQSQINPHFLFNVLVTIGWKAKMSQNETIYRMVTSLSELLQAGIYTDSSAKIPIRQELEYVEFYLYLQKMRFEDRLEYKINIMDESLLDFLIPKLCVETIVENAVVHGIEKKMDKGRVEINIRKNDGSVYFEVMDDGVGFELDSINLSDREIAPNQKKGHSNIGLYNTNKRIKLMYGEQYGITIETKRNMGTKVVIHIPMDKENIPHV